MVESTTVEVDGIEIEVVLDDKGLKAMAEIMNPIPKPVRDAASSFDTVEVSDKPTADYEVVVDTGRDVGSRNLDGFREDDRITLKYVSYDPDLRITLDYDA